jgi:hypothetical protein
MRVLDFTVIGGALVPSNRIKAEGKAAGALIDARDGTVSLVVNVEARRDGLSPTFLTEGKTDSLRVQLRDELTDRLAKEFLQKLDAH